ncbi:DUF1145 domain-containing protein [Orbus sturtevantii]|uniref:DUF1145 domain-containing protein n=1 Tax=Orbus sturtevantii TaxID=3074109 RepID=UPI00370D24DB
MFILIGKAIYLFIWCFLLFNLIYPYPKPANLIAYLALATFVIVHGLQTWLLSSTLSSQEKSRDRFKVLRVFIFGAFEALSWKQKKNK